MRAMILAAGRGERLRPLTDHLPKPLLAVRGRALVEHHILGLAAAGIRELVVNLGWLGQTLREHLGEGSRYGVRIAYSEEGWPALETGGGVHRALPLLGPGPFLLVNGDVYTDYPWAALAERARRLPAQDLAHLVLVPNPAHNPGGDFALAGGRVRNAPPQATFSGLSIHRPELFAGCAAGRFPLLPLWRQAADRDALAGELYTGPWSDVGTLQRLQQLEASHP
ncbi:MAG: nucleotidyltransferase family protein [Nevskia sp.]|nr:nucleotidyltransferase family protein [Nevskia sp.]